MNSLPTICQNLKIYYVRLGFLCLLLGILFNFIYTTAWANTRPPLPTALVVEDIRRLYPSEWEVNYVRGVAYAWELGHLFLLDKTQPATANTVIVTITPYEESISRVEIAFSLDDVINVTFDERGRRLLLFNSQSAELAQVALDKNNILDPASLVRVNVSSWKITKAQGIAFDKSGETLYVLDSAAQQLVRIALNGGSDFTGAAISRADLTYLGKPLSGVAVHPTLGRLFVGSPSEQFVYELRRSGQLVWVHTLWSFDLADPGGLVFTPSADLTDDPQIVHLWIANSNLPQIAPATGGPTPGTLAHTIYLPLVQAQISLAVPQEANTTATPAASLLFGEVVEAALCTPTCSAPTWSFMRQVNNGADDAEERIPTGDMSELFSSDLELIREENTDQFVGIRFQNVPIPQGATIQYAAIEFESDEPENLPTDLAFFGEAVSNSKPFTLTNYNISARALTTATVSWEAVDAWDWIGGKYRTPNLASIVQEIMARPNWKNGNALAFIISGSGRRIAKSYDGYPTGAPKLYVAYTVQSATVPATVETAPVPHSGDAADDPAIWVHPQNSALSTIIGADKQGGIAVYDLTGKELQYLSDHKINNVDLRYNFPLGGQAVALVAGGSSTDDSIVVYRVNPQTRLLENVTARPILSSLRIQTGACMYHSVSTGKYYVILNEMNGGNVEQWELFDNGAGAVDARLVRTFSVGVETEGCVADDELASFYIAAEDVGIWKYGAEPDANAAPTLVDSVGITGHLTADVEGLTIYYSGNGGGYLIASSQGSNQFVVYQRGGKNEYVTTFGIEASPTIDKVSHTDGIDVINVPLGPAFPKGVFVAQDDYNDGVNQNFKLVAWEWIAASAHPQLTVDPWYTKRVKP